MTDPSNSRPLTQRETDEMHMRRAVQLAQRGQGRVEPNPLVGCVVAANEEILAEGWHRVYGQAHAEVDALRQLPPTSDLSSASLYVTLEPCCHTGKTPPCTQAILKSGIRRVVVAIEDPFPEVSGQGLAQLRDAGLEVITGVCGAAGRDLVAPYLKLQQQQRPWIIAKWAMTLDGKLATATGSSQWISNEKSRAIVHQLRGRVDGILVGSRTALLDDPLLTARPPGERVAARLVLDSQAALATRIPQLALARTVHDAPVIVFVSDQASAARVELLASSGMEVVSLAGRDYPDRIGELLDELGRRKMTNVLVEGGAGLLGSLLDAGEIDEVHTFVAPKLVGGGTALSAIHGLGIANMQAALLMKSPHVTVLDGDVYIHGRLQK